MYPLLSDWRRDRLFRAIGRKLRCCSPNLRESRLICARRNVQAAAENPRYMRLVRPEEVQRRNAGHGRDLRQALLRGEIVR